MNGRERFLAALSNKKPDYLPCQVHSWMEYYLKTYLKGMDSLEAYNFIGMDPVMYVNPTYIFNEKDLKNWVFNYKSLGTDRDGVEKFIYTYSTPKGDLTVKAARNKFTAWETEHMIKTEKDFELFKEFYPVADSVDWSECKKIKEQIGDKGIVRMCNNSYGQPGTWQSLTCLLGTENAIMKTFDEPEFMHYALETICDKALKQIENMGEFEVDLVENGGGAASSTVISPNLHKEFCLPYDKRLHKAIKEHGAHVVYHLCGGLMPLLEIVAENGADGLETMTPSSMGGDCNLEEANRRVGDKLCFIGGFDQNEGFERGNKDFIRKEVNRLFEATKENGGYICSPSDHFFFGDPENLKIFVAACRECKY